MFRLSRNLNLLQQWQRVIITEHRTFLTAHLQHVSRFVPAVIGPEDAKSVVINVKMNALLNTTVRFRWSMIAYGGTVFFVLSVLMECYSISQTILRNI